MAFGHGMVVVAAFRRQVPVLACASLLAAAAPAGASSLAQEAMPAVSGVRAAVAPALTLPRATPRPTPYARLFVAPGTEAAPVKAPAPAFQTAPPRPQEPRQNQRRRRTPDVVCGTTLIPADGSIDPGIFAPVGKADGRFTIRAIEPPMCR